MCTRYQGETTQRPPSDPPQPHLVVSLNSLLPRRPPCSYCRPVEDLLFDYFLDFCRHSYKAQLDAYQQAVATLDLRAPHTWYPYARAIHRKIIYHGGGWAGIGFDSLGSGA